MKILLTGSGGFIGSALRRAWAGKYELYAPRHAELDLLDRNAVETYLAENLFDVVVHTANTNDVTHPERADRQLDYNLRMFCNLERCGDLYGKLLYFGSGAEYDKAHYIPKMSEDYFGTYLPADPYGFSKYVMSKLAAASRNIYDLRLFGVFGPGEEWRRRFISNMIFQALNGKEMRMDRNMLFDYLYIEDLTASLELFLHAVPKWHHYNICAGQTVSLRALAELIRSETGTRAEIVMAGTDWKQEYSGDNARFNAEFGPQKLTPIDDAIREMVSFYRENGFQSP